MISVDWAVRDRDACATWSDVSRDWYVMSNNMERDMLSNMDVAKNSRMRSCGDCECDCDFGPD